MKLQSISTARNSSTHTITVHYINCIFFLMTQPFLRKRPNQSVWRKVQLWCFSRGSTSCYLHGNLITTCNQKAENIFLLNVKVAMNPLWKKRFLFSKKIFCYRFIDNDLQNTTILIFVVYKSYIFNLIDIFWFFRIEHAC